MSEFVLVAGGFAMKKYIITIFYHDKRTKEINSMERLKTVPMTEEKFEQVKAERLKKAKRWKQPFTFAVGTWIENY
jgi:hypothetical protein